MLDEKHFLSLDWMLALCAALAFYALRGRSACPVSVSHPSTVQPWATTCMALLTAPRLSDASPQPLYPKTVNMAQLSSTYLDASIVAFCLSPSTAVRIGPNLGAALSTLAGELSDTIGDSWRHLGTTYSLQSLTLIFQRSDAVERSDVRIQRIHHHGNNVVGVSIEDSQLSSRILDQLSQLLLALPDDSKPFLCVEDWHGVGPQHHHIYDRMQEASSSMVAW